MQLNENTPRSRELLVPRSGSKKQKQPDEINNQGGGLDVSNEIINEIIFEKVAPYITGPPTFKNLSKAFLKQIWVTESENDQVKKNSNLIMQFHLIVMNFSLQS